MRLGQHMPWTERKALTMASRFIPHSEPVARAYCSGMRSGIKSYRTALNIREQLIRDLENFLAEWDTWLCPVAPTVAYPHCPLSSFKKASSDTC